YLEHGRFEPRASVQTMSNAMDVGNPSNFERMRWLYGDSLDAMRRDIVGCRFKDTDVAATIKRVYEARGYLMDPHTAIAYMGLNAPGEVESHPERIGVFLATAHPAKFGEIVEPIIGRPVDVPAPLAEVMARPRHVVKINASQDALRRTFDS